MNITINDNDTVPIFNTLSWFTPKSTYIPTETTSRLPTAQPQKRLNCLQIIEICSLCFILIEQTIIFLLTFRKRYPKENFVDNTK